MWIYVVDEERHAMSRHFEIRTLVALPGEDDEHEERLLAILHENLREMGLLFENIQVDVSEPEQK